MGNHLDLVADVGAVIRHLDCLVGGVEPALQPRVMRRDAGRAGIPVAFQGLDAAKGEHEAARRDDEIGADAQRPSNACRGDELSRRDESNALLEPVAFAYVVDERQGLANEQTDIIHQRHGGRAGAAVGGVDLDEVG